MISAWRSGGINSGLTIWQPKISGNISTFLGIAITMPGHPGHPLTLARTVVPWLRDSKGVISGFPEEAFARCIVRFLIGLLARGGEEDGTLFTGIFKTELAGAETAAGGGLRDDVSWEELSDDGSKDSVEATLPLSRPGLYDGPAF